MPTIGQSATGGEGSPRSNRQQRRHPEQATPAAGAGNLNRLAYSPAEAGEVLGISRGRVYQLLADGSINARKLGARTLIEHAELERYIASLPLRETAL